MNVKFILLIVPLLFAIIVVPSRSLAQQKTVKACQDEWRANEADNQAEGVTLKAYVDQCHSGTASPPAAAPTAVPATSAPAAKAPIVASPAAKPPASPTTTGRPSQYSTESLAKALRPSDTVVWENISSHVYHFSGAHSYGNTKSGAYICVRRTLLRKVTAPLKMKSTRKHQASRPITASSERLYIGCIGVLGCGASLDGSGVALTLVRCVVVSNAAVDHMVA